MKITLYAPEAEALLKAIEEADTSFWTDERRLALNRVDRKVRDGITDDERIQRRVRKRNTP
jgi:hypothetical protein